MEPILILGISAGVVAVISARLGTGRFLFLSAANAYVWFYILFIHLGSIVRYLGEGPGGSRFLAMSSLSLIALSLGIMAAGVALGLPKAGTVKTSRALPSPRPGIDLGWRTLGVVSAIGGLTAVAIGFSRAGTLPLLEMLTGGFGDTGAFREGRLAYSKIPGAGYLSQMYLIVLPLAAVGLFLRDRAGASYGNVNRRRLLTAGVIAVGAVSALSGGFRGPLLLIAIFVLCVLSYTQGGLGSRLGVGVMLALLVGGIGLTAAKFGSGSLADAWDSLVHRIVYIQSIGPAFVYSHVPSEIPYQQGGTLLSDFLQIRPGPQTGFSTDLAGIRGARSHNNPVGAVADIYLNFGPVGVVLFSFLLGVVCQVLHSYLIAGPKTITTLVPAAGVTMGLVWSSIAGVVGSLFQFGIATSIAVWLALQVFPLMARTRGRAPVHPTKEAG